MPGRIGIPFSMLRCGDGIGLCDLSRLLMTKLIFCRSCFMCLCNPVVYSVQVLAPILLSIAAIQWASSAIVDVVTSSSHSQLLLQRHQLFNDFPSSVSPRATLRFTPSVTFPAVAISLRRCIFCSF
jgi:hypothetical protein